MHTQPSRQNGCPWRCSEDAGQDHATESTKASCTWPATTDRKSWPQQDSEEQQLRSTTRQNLRQPWDPRPALWEAASCKPLPVPRFNLITSQVLLDKVVGVGASGIVGTDVMLQGQLTRPRHRDGRAQPEFGTSPCLLNTNTDRADNTTCFKCMTTIHPSILASSAFIYTDW